MTWNCGGGFSVKLPAILASCGDDADIFIITETHLPPSCPLPDVPGYSCWLFSREGAKRASGGIAVLVHERLAAHVQPWQPTTCKQLGPSPYYTWFRMDAASGLARPLLFAAVYLTPYNSKYGLRSRQQLEDFFTRLGDEAAEGTAQLGGADFCLAGDWNGHLGCIQEAGECSTLRHALGEEADEVLAPVASACALPFPITARASMCSAPVCEQGRAVMQFCSDAGMFVMNGRVPGDELGSPTCYAGSPSIIDLFIGSPGLLAQATRLRVLEAVPEYTMHRPVELRLALSAPAAGGLQHQPSQPQQQPAAAAAAADAATFGPPPSLPPSLRLKDGLMPHFKQQLAQPAASSQLHAAEMLAADDPEAAAALLHAALYEAAAAVFPAASSARQPQQRDAHGGQQRLHQLPYFDRECSMARAATRQRIRALMGAEPRSHLAQQAVRVVGSKYRALLDRKHAIWRRQHSRGLLHLHTTNAKAFYKKWKSKAAANPIEAAAWLRHFVHLQQLRKFKPTCPQPAAQQPASAATQPDSPTATLADPSLDEDWTPDDVLEACKKLSSSSACLGPLKAALIKAGKEVLAPVLASLFTAVFRSGKVPREWLLGAITAIHKKGDTTNPNNYRGITVGHVLGKLYALMLNLRLTAWAEANGKRAVGQAGFRQGFRTTDNCFILRALAERARARGVKLYICAVDLEKAFDCVDRPLLWASLQRAGVGGSMLATLQALYADVPVCVKTAEGMSGTFLSTIGVKQGCPLSPLLFGIFLDDFEQHVQRAVPDAVGAFPRLGGRPVPPMLFADDMLLMSTSVAGLNAQLLALQTYCDSKQLTVNAAKTQVMIMRPGGGGGGPAAAERFFYAGRQLDVVKSIKYLGLTFSQLSKAWGFSCCADELAKAGRRALFAMRRRAWELGAGATEHQLQLFDIFVKPVLSYGCEVWGVDILGQPGSAPERVHRWFCRRLLGLPQSACSATALAELGRWPLHVHWAQQLSRFWNRLLELQGSDRLVSWAFQDNLELMREQLAHKARTGQEAASPCWCLRWLRSLAAVAPTGSGTLLGVTELDEKAVVARARVEFARAAAAGSGTAAADGSGTAAAAGDGSAPPRVEEGEQGAGLHGCAGRDGCASHAAGPVPTGRPLAATKFAMYLETVRGDTPLGQLAPHLYHDAVADERHRSCLSRFRCSAHALRVERDRHLPAAVKAPRHLRTCLICASDRAEDEQHFVFSCPLYDGLRLEFADLFSTESFCVSSFLYQDQKRIAKFLHACFDLRSRATQMSLAGS